MLSVQASTPAIGSFLSEDLTVDAAGHAEEAVNFKAFVGFLIEGFGGLSPGHDFLDFRSGEEAKNGEVLTAAAGDLAAKNDVRLRL